MSTSASSSLATTLDEQQKADQIALHVYTKLFHVVHQARASLDAPLVAVGGAGGSASATSVGGKSVCATGSVSAGSLERERERTGKTKIDRWFNLETPDSDLFSRELREVYKAISTIAGGGGGTTASPPPLYIHVLLSVPEAMNNHVLVALAQSNSRTRAAAGTTTTTTMTTGMGPSIGTTITTTTTTTTATTPPSSSPSRIRIEPTPRYVLLERFALTFTVRPRDIPPPTDIALPTIYKHGIPLFRSLFSLLRILPAWKLYKKLRRRMPGPSSQLAIQLCVSDRELGGDLGEGGVEGGVLIFDVPPSPNHPPLPTLTHTLPSIPHPLGSFTLSVTYLESPTFQLDDLESLLSSRFISLDEGFVPTLAGAGGLGGKPRSDMSSQAESIAEKFVIPPPPPAATTTITTTAVPGGGGGAGSLKIGAGTTIHHTMGSGSASSSPGHAQTQAHFSHLRQQPLSVAHTHHRSDSSISSSGISGSPSSTTHPALSRLRLEPSPGPGRRSFSGSGTGLPSPGPPSPVAAVSPSSPVPVPGSISAPRLQPSYSQPSSLGREVTNTTTHASIMASGMGSGSQALPIRRPSVINPFKTNTLLGAGSGGGTSGSGSGIGAPGTSAGSTHSIHSVHSLRHATSPLGHGGDLLSKSPPHPSPLTFSHSHSAQLQPFPTQQSPHPPHSPQHSGSAFPSGAGSGLGSGSGSGSDVGLLPLSPSSSLPRGQQSMTSTTSMSVSIQQGQRKRYSSSFSHRYTSSGSVGVSIGGGSSRGGSASPRGISPRPGSPFRTGVGTGGSSDGIGGSGPGGVRGTPSPGPDDIILGKSRSRSSSFLGKRTEDDDISSFMQDIETRKPLSGRWRMSVHERECSGESAEGGGASKEGERFGRHSREGTSGTDGTDSTDRTVKAGGPSVTLEMTTTRGPKDGEPLHATGTAEITPTITAIGPNETNNEENEVLLSLSKRASHTYQSHPYNPSPLSPHPRPIRHPPQTQSQLTPEHSRHGSRGSPSRSLDVTGAGGVETMTSTGSGPSSNPRAGPSTSPPGAIPTTQAEVEVRLKKMNETFLKSLAGFGDGWGASGSIGSQGRSLSEGRRSNDSEVGARTGPGVGVVPRAERFESRGGRDRERISGDLTRLSQQGPEEVIGTLELGGGGGRREDSMERGRQVGMGRGSLGKPPSLVRYR
ncbi:hypothetical protein AX15_000549 [Amanita polypyramis BW_CC]|nr:hypothetical protein AX15_000549 [Amanita polypyramis BW_CC]